MALNRKSKETVETPATPSETAPVVPAEKKPVVRRFVGKRFSYYHPFQKKTIPVGGDGVILEMDSWLKSQVDAGYIVEV